MTADTETFFFIRCNGADVLINDEAKPGPELCGEWGSEQCAGCGCDIIETGTVTPLLTHVRCTCGAVYPVQTTTQEGTRPWM